MMEEENKIEDAFKLSEEILEIMCDKHIAADMDDYPELRKTISENRYAVELLRNLTDQKYLKESVNYIGDATDSAERLQRKVARTGTRKIAKRVAAWSISAAACIALVVAGFNLIGDRGIQGNMVSDHSRATLTLADDSIVELDNVSRGIYEQNESKIIVEKDGLKYTASADNDMIVYNKLSVPRGGEYFVELADGTQVWLNAQTQLRFPVDFVGDERRVLLSGDAYFAVMGDKFKPFIVETGLGEVRVHGTQFNVKQYPDQNCVQATLVEGSVSFASDGVGETMLSPDHRLSYVYGSVPVVEKVNVQDQIAWKNKQFRFDEQSLYEIMTSLSRWYDMDVVFSSESLKEIRLSGILNRSDDMRKLLNLFEQTSDVEFIVEGRKVTVMRK